MAGWFGNMENPTKKGGLGVALWLGGLTINPAIRFSESPVLSGASVEGEVNGLQALSFLWRQRQSFVVTSRAWGGWEFTEKSRIRLIQIWGDVDVGGKIDGFFGFFPTCQVRVVRFYVSCLLLLSSSPPLLLSSPPLLLSSPPLLSSSSCSTAIHAQCALPDLNHDHPRSVCPAGPQPRPSPPSVPCRTSTASIPAQCSLPDLNHDHPRSVCPAGPQPRPSPPSVPCRTSTASIHAKCSLPDLM